MPHLIQADAPSAVVINFAAERIARFLTDERLEAILRKIRAEEQAAPAIVEKAIRILAGNILRRYSPDGAFDGNMLGKMTRKINLQWFWESGPLHDDLRRKHEWVRLLSEQIKANKDLPQWLVI